MRKGFMTGTFPTKPCGGVSKFEPVRENFAVDAHRQHRGLISMRRR
jgi:hypothetical protein